jgi:hypothetical protein
MRTRFAAIAVLLLWAIAMRAGATTITVTNTNDSGPGSLRQALVDANDGDTIAFAVTGTIVLTSGGLVIDKEITISGPGADQLSINGNHAQSQCVFGIAAANTVTISGLTITNGDCGIYSDHATLAVSNCVVTHNNGNYSVGGIGINNMRGPAAPLERGNPRDVREAYADYPAGFPSLTVANCVISDNSGSGVENLSAAVTIINSTITGNSIGNPGGHPGEGGGVYTGGGKLPGNLTVTNSTISGNFALVDGGGISCGISGLTIINSTISGNSTGDPDYGYGGGVAASTVTIANSTVSGNSAATCGGVCGGTVEIGNTILNANTAGNIDGSVTSRGYNVCSDDAGGLLNGPGDQINTDPLLGPLQDNGGPTLTHLPLLGSPAIDAGDPNFVPPPFRDQRGSCFHRVFGRRIDVGSVETQPKPRCVRPAPRPSPHAMANDSGSQSQR